MANKFERALKYYQTELGLVMEAPIPPTGTVPIRPGVAVQPNIPTSNAIAAKEGIDLDGDGVPDTELPELMKLNPRLKQELQTAADLKARQAAETAKIQQLRAQKMKQTLSGPAGV